MDLILSVFDKSFISLDSRSRQLLAEIDEPDLYRRPRQLKREMTPFSCGEYILRSAAMVEKTFGGITTRLWDDPFEWTLPEKLSTKESIINYLDETEATRKRGFCFFTSDADLLREIPAPQEMHSIADVLTGTLLKAAHYQGRAFAIFQTLSDEQLPRI
jgi:hypothetical protein